MHSAMPPLNGLRAFEVTARHLSMTEAAKELNVTAGALSHQIRALEDFPGKKLFERGVRSLSLTREGQYLQPGLEAAFRQIKETVAGLRTFSAENVLVVSCTHGFNAKWLATRLYDFAVAHPELDVRLASSFRIANFVTDGIDLARLSHRGCGRHGGQMADRQGENRRSMWFIVQDFRRSMSAIWPRPSGSPRRAIGVVERLNRMTPYAFRRSPSRVDPPWAMTLHYPVRKAG